MKPQLSLRDGLLALAVVFVWGTNFVVIRLGLNVLPPLFFATLRFFFVLFPACLLLPVRERRRKPERQKICVVGQSGLLWRLPSALVQFGLLFIAMNGQIPPGLASLVVQMQVFFTIGLAMWRTGERIKPHQIAAFALALAGMGVIAAHSGPQNGRSTTCWVWCWCCWRRWAGPWATRPAARHPQRIGQHAGLCGVGGAVRGAAAAGAVAAAGRPRRHRRGTGARHAADLGRGAVAVGGQHHVRLCLLGLAVVALSRRHRGAHVAAGAGVRLRRQRRPAGRAPAVLEDRRHPADHGRAGGEFAVAARRKRDQRRSRHDAFPSFSARRGAGPADRLFLGHQFRGGALGTGDAAAAADGGHPLRAGAVPRHPLPQKAQHLLGQPGAVRPLCGHGTVRASLYRHERLHLARHGLAGDADAGLLHHRGRGLAHRREAPHRINCWAWCRRSPGCADPDAQWRRHHARGPGPVLGGAVCWAISNQTTREAARARPRAARR